MQHLEGMVKPSVIQDNFIALFEGRKLNFVSGVRNATGCSVWIAHHAVCMCMATNKAKLDFDPGSYVGDFGDFIRTVRYVIALSEYVHIEDTPSSEMKGNLNKALRVIKSHERLESITDMAVDYWDMAYDGLYNTRASRVKEAS